MAPAVDATTGAVASHTAVLRPVVGTVAWVATPSIKDDPTATLRKRVTGACRASKGRLTGRIATFRSSDVSRPACTTPGVGAPLP